MAFSSGAQRDLFYKREAVYGVTPYDTGAVIRTTGFSELRNTEDSISLARDNFVSDERRGDRGIHDLRLGNKQPAGDIGFEFGYTAFDDFLEAALCSDLIASAVSVSTNVNATIVAATGVITFVGETIITDGYEVGDNVLMEDWVNTGNNGTFVITAIPDETHMTVYPVTDLTNEACLVVDLTAYKTAWPIAGTEEIKKGTHVTSFSVIKSFSDIARYQLFTGGIVNTMSLDIKPNGMVTGSFGMLFKDMSSGAGDYVTDTPSVVGTTAPFDGFTGSITEGGAAIATVSGLTLNLDNGFERNFVLMSNANPQVTSGKSNITGTVTLFFEDSTEYDKFVDETESEIVITLQDLDANTIEIDLPRIKYTSAETPVNSDGATIITMNFQALDDSGEASNIVITRS